jgi:SAM-dependent methyltransferase
MTSATRGAAAPSTGVRIDVDVDTAAGLLRFGNLFCDAQALLTAVRFDLFTVLHEGPADPEAIRRRLGLHGRGLADFLNLLVALDLLEYEDGRYRNTPAADRYLVAGAPEDVSGFLRGAGINLYPVYADLTEAVRTGRPQAVGDFESMLDDPIAVGHFVRMMDGLTRRLLEELTRAVDWSGRRSVVDLGGCRGSLAAHLVENVPGLAGHVYDRPQIEPFFDELMAERGLTGRVTFHPGDFFREPVPSGDVLIYGHILHDWDPGRRALLLRKAYDALHPGGLLVIYDRMLPAGRDNVDNLVTSLNMLLVTEGGAEYTVPEIEEQASAAGFASTSHRPFGDHDTLVFCHKA